MDELHSQLNVAVFIDPKWLRSATCRRLLRRKPETGREITPFGEGRAVAYGCSKRVALTRRYRDRIQAPRCFVRTRQRHEVFVGGRNPTIEFNPIIATILRHAL